MLALSGEYDFDEQSQPQQEQHETDLQLAHKLAATCHALYKGRIIIISILSIFAALIPCFYLSFLFLDQVTGIGPEIINFARDMSHSERSLDYSIASARFLLRPETLESLFVLYRRTADPKYRKWAWDIFQVITVLLLYTLSHNTADGCMLLV